MRLKEYGIRDAADWEAARATCEWACEDVYFGPSWYATWEEAGYGTARCLHGEEDGMAFLYPFLYRPVEGYEAGRGSFDAETAYGYGGLIVTKGATPEFIGRANAAVDGWMREGRVLAEFVRFHPDLSPAGSRRSTPIHVRDDVFLRIRGRPEAEVWGLLPESARRAIRTGERRGLQVEVTADLAEGLAAFQPVYAEAARRIGMDSFYLFPHRYFEAFRRHMGGRAVVITVRVSSEVAASSIWLTEGETMHYYLGATHNAYTRHSCSDAYFWRAVRFALEATRFSCVHFGGGLTSAPTDSLFLFKAKYGDQVKPVHVGKRVHDEAVYARTRDEWAQRYPALVTRFRSHLLCYRNVQPQEALHGA